MISACTTQNMCIKGMTTNNDLHITTRFMSVHVSLILLYTFVVHQCIVVYYVSCCITCLNQCFVHLA